RNDKQTTTNNRPAMRVIVVFLSGLRSWVQLTTVLALSRRLKHKRPRATRAPTRGRNPPVGAPPPATASARDFSPQTPLRPSSPPARPFLPRSGPRTRLVRTRATISG